MHKTKTQTRQPQQGASPRGKIEVLPNAIHTITTNAISECYGVVGIAAPRLRNGQAILLPPEHSNQGVRVREVNGQIVIEVYVVLEFGLRISEIAHNIMSSVKFSIEKMLGIPISQVNVNVQGLAHSASPEAKEK